MRSYGLAVILAFAFAGWGLRGSRSTDVQSTDEARHAMNGAALHDLVRDGGLGHPVAYLRHYFARYPALSMPYHPPLFPAIEAGYFAVLGVTPWAARLAVATCVFGSVLLFFRLVAVTTGCPAMAAASVITFFCLRRSQWLAAEVMLEMPALLFILACLNLMVNFERGWTVKEALWSGLFAAASIWTKQTIFLGLIPPLWILLSRRWDLLRTRALLVFTSIYVVSFAGLAVLTVYSGIPFVSRAWAPVGFAQRVWLNAAKYLTGGWAGPIVFAASFIAAVLLMRRRLAEQMHPAFAIYLCWLVATMAVLILVPVADPRYLFFAHPAAIVLGFFALQRLAAPLLGLGRARLVPGIIALFAVVANAGTKVPSVTGFGDAARYISSSGGRRVLYAGWSDGSFTFAFRATEPPSTSVIFRGEKLPWQTFRPAELEAFAHQYGIDYIVLEKRPYEQTWDYLTQRPTQHMVLARVIPLRHSPRSWSTSLYVFKYTNPSSRPSNSLPMILNPMGSTLDFYF